MPTIVTDEAVLTANGLPADAVHRGERVCRWSGCAKRRKVYSGASRLRFHYKGKHQYEYTKHTVGKASPYIEKQHENGLQYLAFSAQGITDVVKSWPESC